METQAVNVKSFLFSRNVLKYTGCPKKMSFLGKKAVTTFKIIQNAKVGGVLENSGYLLPDGH